MKHRCKFVELYNVITNRIDCKFVISKTFKHNDDVKYLNYIADDEFLKQLVNYY